MPRRLCACVSHEWRYLCASVGGTPGWQSGACLRQEMHGSLPPSTGKTSLSLPKPVLQIGQMRLRDIRASEPDPSTCQNWTEADFLCTPMSGLVESGVGLWGRARSVPRSRPLPSPPAGHPLLFQYLAHPGSGNCPRSLPSSRGCQETRSLSHHSLTLLVLLGHSSGPIYNAPPPQVT